VQIRSTHYPYYHYPKTWRTDLPTVKQLELLRTLGCRTEPQTKAEASRLIDETINKKGSYERNTSVYR
jgi:hypothetical protein